MSCGNVFRAKAGLGNSVKNLTRAQRIKYSLCKHLLSRKKYDKYFPGYRKYDHKKAKPATYDTDEMLEKLWDKPDAPYREARMTLGLTLPQIQILDKKGFFS